MAYVLQNGLMNAQADGTFGISEAVSRETLVTALWKLSGSPVVNYAMNFRDVPENSDGAEAIRWAASEGVVTGDTDGSFRPAATLAREQAAAILYRYAQENGVDVSVGENTNILSYRDAEQIHTYAVPAMQWACGAGILQGTAAGDLAPQNTLTRVQLAVILLRADLSVHEKKASPNS